MWFVYLVECSDKTLYCGITKDLEKRVKAHNSGRGAKYTRSRRPVKLKWNIQCENQNEALDMEAFIKAMARPDKLDLIGGDA